MRLRLGGKLLLQHALVDDGVQVDEHLLEFSADYWHDVRAELRRRLGENLSVLGLCGAAGVQSPHFLM